MKRTGSTGAIRNAFHPSKSPGGWEGDRPVLRWEGAIADLARNPGLRHAHMVDHEGYKSPATGAGRIGCAVASIFGIVFGLPFFFIATYASGGCEGAPRPCESDNTWFWLALIIIALLCTAVGLLTRRAILRFQRRKR